MTYHNTFTNPEIIKLFSTTVKSPTRLFHIIIGGPLALKLDGAVCLSRAKLLDILFIFPISTGISGFFFL
jgi:hypothetical protein